MLGATLFIQHSNENSTLQYASHLEVEMNIILPCRIYIQHIDEKQHIAIHIQHSSEKNSALQ